MQVRGYVSSQRFLALFGSAVVFGCHAALQLFAGIANTSRQTGPLPAVALPPPAPSEGTRWTESAVSGSMRLIAGD